MRWRTTGLRIGLSKNQLQEWDKSCRKYGHDNPTACWCRVMGHWLDGGGTPDYPASWEGLDRLLKDVGCSREAEELKKATILATLRPPVKVPLSRRVLGFLVNSLCNRYSLVVVLVVVSAALAYIERRL